MKAPPLLSLVVLFAVLASASAAPEEEISSRIRRIPVTSSNVASIGYSRHHALEIKFVRGAVYRFFDVQPRLYRQPLAADSKGRFIAENLRGKYRFVRVRPRHEENGVPERGVAEED